MPEFTRFTETITKKQDKRPEMNTAEQDFREEEK